MRINLNLNKSLSIDDQALQYELLKLINEFGEIARDMSYLLDDGRLRGYTSIWSDAQESAFSSIIKQHYSAYYLD